MSNVELYWVSLLVQDTENSKPWLCAMSDGCLSSEEAKGVINKGKSNYRVLSAWIDTFDNDNVKATVFHECYINAMGAIKKLRISRRDVDIKYFTICRQGELIL